MFRCFAPKSSVSLPLFCVGMLSSCLIYSEDLLLDEGQGGSTSSTTLSAGGMTTSSSSSATSSTTSSSTTSTASGGGMGGADPMVVWINELHYDDEGADDNEGVEIAGSAGLDLSGFQILAVSSGSGNDGVVYDTVQLNGVLTDQQGGLGTIWFPIPGLQNGPADGVALIDPNSMVVQFLSYEGTLTGNATSGPLNGVTSVEVGVSEENTQAHNGTSLSLQGTGSDAPDFTWASMVTASPGSPNPSQTFN